MYTRILCPVDFSEGASHAADLAIAMARSHASCINAQHVYKPVLMPVPGLPAPEERVSEAELSRVRAETAKCFERAATLGIRVDATVDVGEPAIGILRRASEWPADLIVMGTHGASGFERLVLGSVTEKVLRKATCPVLTVPPHAQATSRLPFRRLLCAIDFSDWSLQALDHAATLAQQSGAELTLLHTLEWPWSEPPAPDLH